MPEEEAAELERLAAEHDQLLEAQYDEEGEDDPAVTEQLEALGERISALEAKARAWTQEQMAHAQAGGEVFGRPPTLTEAQRAAVREQIAAGASVSALARRYGTSRQTVMRAREISSPPAAGRPTLDETGPAATVAIPSLIRRHRGRFFYGAEEPVN